MPLGGRARRQERREDRQEARQERRGDGEDEEFDDSGPASYVMREKLLAFGNDFEIKKASRRQGGRIGPTAFYVVSLLRGSWMCPLHRLFYFQ